MIYPLTLKSLYVHRSTKSFADNDQSSNVSRKPAANDWSSQQFLSHCIKTEIPSPPGRRNHEWLMLKTTFFFAPHEIIWRLDSAVYRVTYFPWMNKSPWSPWRSGTTGHREIPAGASHRCSSAASAAPRRRTHRSSPFYRLCERTPPENRYPRTCNRERRLFSSVTILSFVMEGVVAPFSRNLESNVFFLMGFWRLIISALICVEGACWISVQGENIYGNECSDVLSTFLDVLSKIAPLLHYHTFAIFIAL